MKYNCTICEYSTNDRSNYNKHVKSSTHNRNINYLPIINSCMFAIAVKNIITNQDYVNIELNVCI